MEKLEFIFNYMKECYKMDYLEHLEEKVTITRLSIPRYEVEHWLSFEQKMYDQVFFKDKGLIEDLE